MPSSIFRTTLLGEAAANIGSIVHMFLAPEAVLSYLVNNNLQITPSTRSLTQWIGALIVLATAPLLLSYTEDGTRAEILAKRRLTYQIMGLTEVAIGSVTLSQYLSGDSGLKDGVLVTATGTSKCLIHAGSTI